MRFKPQLSAVPLLFPALFLSVGTFIGLSYHQLWIAGITALAAVVTTLFRFRYVAILLCLTALGMTRAYFCATQAPASFCPGNEYLVSGDITEIHSGGRGQRFLMTVDTLFNVKDSDGHPLTTSFRLDVFLPDFMPEFSEHQHLKLRVRPENNEYVKDHPEETTTESGAQYRCIIEPDDIVATAPGHGLKATLSRWRGHITHIIYMSDIDAEAKPFVNAIITGDTRNLLPETRREFSDAGISHILALSGLHVGLFAMLIAIVLFPLAVAGRHSWRTAGVICVVWIYAAVTGMSPSVFRAALMLTLFLTAKLIQRQPSSVNALLFAAITIQIIDPEALCSISFQLSFTAVLAILLLSPYLNPISPRRHNLHTAADFLCVSVAAMIGTALPSIVYFHYFPVYFLIANIVVSVLLPPFLLCSIAVVALSAMGVEWCVTTFLVDTIHTLISGTAEMICRLPGSTIADIDLAWWVAIPYVVAVASLYLSLAFRKKAYYVTLSVSLAALLLCLIASADSERHNPEMVILCNKSHTDVMIYDGSTTLSVATSSPQTPIDIKSNVRYRFDDFMRRRAIDSISIVPENRMRRNLVVNFSDTRLVMVCEPTDSALPEKCDYLLVCQGFRGAVEELCASCRPDTLIIGYDLQPRRAEAIIESCRTAGIPHIWLRQKRWRLVQPISRNPIVKKVSP